MSQPSEFGGAPSVPPQTTAYEPGERIWSDSVRAASNGGVNELQVEFGSRSYREPPQTAVV